MIFTTPDEREPMTGGLLGATVAALVLGLILVLAAGPIARSNLRWSKGWPGAPEDPSRPPVIWTSRYLRIVGAACLVVGLVLLVVGLVTG